MADDTPPPSRKEQILQALATMLEQSPGGRITTARLAAQVGVSEAALYRHFPSKARMYEGLISFIEETLFERITRILDEQQEALPRCHQIMTLVLAFTEKNPGLSRLLGGDVLTGETARLRQRIHQLFERLDTQFKQVLREAELREGRRLAMPASAGANLLTAQIEGRIAQYVRSDYRHRPTEHWEDQWPALSSHLLRDSAIPA